MFYSIIMSIYLRFQNILYVIKYKYQQKMMFYRPVTQAIFLQQSLAPNLYYLCAQHIISFKFTFYLTFIIQKYVQIYEIPKILQIKKMLNRFVESLENTVKEAKGTLNEAPVYKKYSINPLKQNKELSEQQLDEKAKQIFEWAKANGATHYTFFAYPQTEGVCQKQDQFLDLKYFYENSLSSTAGTAFKSQHLIKCEGDGSSFPSGGLRVTHSARAYMMWDPKSQIFLRKRNNVLYIPSILVAHNGDGLDDKTLLRKSELKLQEHTKRLLGNIGIKATNVFMGLGMQQQFFVIPKDAYLKRLDIRSCNRALINPMPPKNQQFSDHYYGKLPNIVQQILRQVETQLFEIGVPVKTRHKEVALNQFQFCPLFQDAGKAIDHNMIMMEILKEAFDRHGFTALFHEKPFNKINGSGKHCNWSLNYIDQTGKSKNLFSVPRTGTEEQKKIFRLFILLNLQAIANNSKLYLSSISTAGNELRLGGHEAPPRIISSFLGDTVTAILDGKELHDIKNFKDNLPNVNYDLYQEDTDRNRTSPYAFAGNKFQFRAVGSSQNTSFPMAVIAATMASEMSKVNERLQKGESLDKILEQLTESSRCVRFEGNGYSKEWTQQAKKRGLYVNTEISESIQNLKQGCQVFVDIGACSQAVATAKYNNASSLYINTVNTEIKTLQTILSRQIMPRCYAFGNQVTNDKFTGKIKQRGQQFLKLFDALIVLEQEIDSYVSDESDNITEVCRRRGRLNQICEKIDEISAFLPKNKEFPDLQDFMNLY